MNSEPQPKLAAQMPAEGKGVNHNLVRLLEKALEDAKAGRVTGGGVALALGPSNFMATAAFGAQPAEVMAAAQLLVADIIEAIRQMRQSRIMRAGAMPGMKN